jgi:hypothetical protein
MSPEGRSRRTKRVDKNNMPDTSTAPPVEARQAPIHAQRVRQSGSSKEDWIANQLRKVYDDALEEAIPKDMLDLLNALDEDDDSSEEEASG